jgi:hypothetical protein
MEIQLGYNSDNNGYLTSGYVTHKKLDLADMARYG